MKKQMTNAPPGPGTTAEDILWQKIQQFPLDDPEAHYPFSRKLAKENKWDQPFTERAISEYRKFLWLCCISPHGASPSAVIDQVWHLHLLYTKNYWEDFCAQTIQRNLHHHPSSGGPVQQDRHEAWQTDTLRLYRTFFQSEPPPDIWVDHQPGQKRNLLQRLARKITGLALFLPMVLLSSCGVSDFAGPLIFFLFISLISAAGRHNSPEEPRRKKDGEHCSSGSSGGSCGSSCSSSCSSSCGSGCGGCGGGD